MIRVFKFADPQRVQITHPCAPADADDDEEKSLTARRWWARGRADGLGLAIQMVENVVASGRANEQQERILLEVYDSLWEAKDARRKPLNIRIPGEVTSADECA